ncbi:hypothetical protein [Alkaliphilus sp. B6464]|uniref:hypothetical protein n=1 Tax=Alkaliphilus sp. B6464 TaxID=2731219 RepID=UPI001BA4CF32|nr:hypothetical protein [Alkaliphilus sp. B6464]QUH21795.1 hypothetical protein HYG84_17825 [Alkaliphilus sp. B6464]
MNRDFSLEINNKEKLKYLLSRDKHAILEGVCTEHLFQNDVLPRKKWNNKISLGWWTTRQNNDYIFFKVSSEYVTQNDISIFRHFIKNNMKCIYVKFENTGTYKFLEVNSNIYLIEKNNYIEQFLSFNEFIIKYNLKEIRQPLLAANDVRDTARQEKAIDFFDKNGLLEDTAIQRHFANFFLTVYYGYAVWNIDGLLVDNDKVLAYEIKFKYPTKSNTFGLNIGVAKLFEWLHNKDIKIYHAILLNPTNSEKVSVLDVLSNKSLYRETNWICYRINPTNLFNSSGIAPSKTQIEGRTDQKVVYIPVSNFKYLKNLEYKNA